MKKTVKIIFVILLIVGLYSCAHHHSANEKKHIVQMKVTASNATSTLYYAGNVEPIKTNVVTSPTDGVINEMEFHFGDEVQSGQLLFSISSDKFQTDYKTALMQYIKTKTEYANVQSQLREGEFLHKNQLISDDDYKAKKTNYYNAKLAMVQAKDILDNMQKQIELHGVDLYNLKIEDIDKITRVLHEQNALRQIHIAAPATGVVLLPNKDELSGELKKISKGDVVKQGEVIAVIGDVSGLMLHINVNEFNVNQLKIGQKVKVTGAAFPDFVLEGDISAINRQAETLPGGLPEFPVEVIVPMLTPKQQAIIHMGMSAKVAIEMGGSSKIRIPIQAVIQKKNKTYVTVKNEKNGKYAEREVKTGETTLDSVVIDSGLEVGAHIVFTD